jgi:hypothetical protein
MAGRLDMRFFKITLVFLVVLGLLPMTGCGGSDSSSANVDDPLAPGGTTPPQTPTGAGTVLNYTMTLSTLGSSGSSTVGSNSNVVATATLKDNNNRLISGQPVRFEEVKANPADPAAVIITDPVVQTSSEGIATKILKTAETTVNRDVIIKASTSIDGKSISSVSIIKVVRSAGNYINFITTSGTSDPDGNLNRLTVTIDAVDPVAVPSYDILQLVTFEVLDKNGLDRTLVPVKLELFNLLGSCTVSIGSPGAATETVTTDNTGLGIFSDYATISTPPIGSENSCSIIYKATALDDSVPPKELFSYGGYIVNLKNVKP